MSGYHRVFLSHGAEHRSEGAEHRSESEESVDRMAEALRDAGYEVFEYRQAAEPRTDWQYRLLVALLLCDCAVVLLDRRARTRKWVRYEQAVLAARRDLEDFSLITVEVGRDPREVVRALGPAPGRTGEAGYIDTVRDAVRRAARILDDVDCKCCIDALVIERRVQGLLKSVPAGAIHFLLDEVKALPDTAGSDVPWDVLTELQRATARSPDQTHTLAQEIVRKGPLAAVPLRGFMNRSNVEHLLTWLEPLQIPLRAIAPLAALFTREIVPPGAYVVRGADFRTLQSAVRRAWGAERGPSLRTPIVRAQPAAVESPTDDVAKQIVAGLRAYFGLSSSDLDDARVLAELARRGLIQAPGGTDQNAGLAIALLGEVLPLHELIQRFPYLVFIVASDHETPATDYVDLGIIDTTEADDVWNLVQSELNWRPL